MTTILLSIASGLLAALSATLLYAVRTIYKDHALQDEAFKKILLVQDENVKTKLELAQVIASRDQVREALGIAESNELHAQNAKALAEGQRDELLKELQAHAPGSALVNAINSELRALSKLSTKRGGNS